MEYWKKEAIGVPKFERGDRVRVVRYSPPLARRDVPVGATGTVESTNWQWIGSEQCYVLITVVRFTGDYEDVRVFIGEELEKVV